MIETLEHAKAVSQIVEERLKLQKVTYEQINSARESYRSVATRGSILYFAIQEMVCNIT